MEEYYGIALNRVTRVIVDYKTHIVTVELPFKSTENVEETIFKDLKYRDEDKELAEVVIQHHKQVE